MKKILYIAGALALTLSSCTNDVTETMKQNAREISFSVYNKTFTRTTAETDASTLQSNGFKVYATSTNTEASLPQNAIATYNSNVGYLGYYTSDTFYWPESGTVDFYAIYPTSNTIAVSGSAVTTALSDATAKTDFIAAQKLGQSGTGNGRVAFAFDHIGSEVLFTVQPDGNYVYSNISISAVANTAGTYSFTGSTWSNTSTSSLTLCTADTVTNFAMEVGKAKYLMEGDATTDRITELNYFVVPGTITITAKYKVSDNSGATLMDFTATGTEKTATVTVEPGKKTVINLTLPSGVTPIQVATSVSPWPTATESSATL